MMMVWIQICLANIFFCFQRISSLSDASGFLYVDCFSLAFSKPQNCSKTVQDSCMSSVLCCILCRIRHSNLSGRTIQKVLSRLALRIVVKQWQVNQLTRHPEGEIEEKETWSYFFIRFENCYLQEQYDVRGCCLCSHCVTGESLICILHQHYLEFFCLKLFVLVYSLFLFPYQVLQKISLQCSAKIAKLGIHIFLVVQK